jgi:hypothetical protein
VSGYHYPHARASPHTSASRGAGIAVGLLDRLRAGGREDTLRVRVRDGSGTFAGSKGDAIWGAGYVPVDDAGEPLPESEHRTSNPRVHHCLVAGTHYNPSALADERFDPGARVTLRADPGNPSDPHAVGIWDASGAVQVGYVPATLSRSIAGPLRRGTRMGGEVLRELRVGSAQGPRTALYVLIAPGPIELEER